MVNFKFTKYLFYYYYDFIFNYYIINTNHLRTNGILK